MEHSSSSFPTERKNLGKEARTASPEPAAHRSKIRFHEELRQLGFVFKDAHFRADTGGLLKFEYAREARDGWPALIVIFWKFKNKYQLVLKATDESVIFHPFGEAIRKQRVAEKIRRLLESPCTDPEIPTQS